MCEVWDAKQAVDRVNGWWGGGVKTISADAAAVEGGLMIEGDDGEKMRRWEDEKMKR